MKRFGNALVVFLLAIVLSAIGFVCGLQIVRNLASAVETAGWVETPATVVSSRLEEFRGKKSSSYQARADYRFEFKGKLYTSRQIATEALANSDMGEAQKDLAATLKEAEKSGKPISAWVNPDDPTQSVLNRSIPWGLILLLLPFALVFGGLGLGTFYASYRIAMGNRTGPRKEPRTMLGKAWRLSGERVPERKDDLAQQLRRPGKSPGEV